MFPYPDKRTDSSEGDPLGSGGLLGAYTVLKLTLRWHASLCRPDSGSYIEDPFESRYFQAALRKVLNTICFGAMKESLVDVPQTFKVYDLHICCRLSFDGAEDEDRFQGILAHSPRAFEPGFVESLVQIHQLSLPSYTHSMFISSCPTVVVGEDWLCSLASILQDIIDTIDYGKLVSSWRLQLNAIYFGTCHLSTLCRRQHMKAPLVRSLHVQSYGSERRAVLIEPLLDVKFIRNEQQQTPGHSNALRLTRSQPIPDHEAAAPGLEINPMRVFSLFLATPTCDNLRVPALFRPTSFCLHTRYEVD